MNILEISDKIKELQEKRLEKAILIENKQYEMDMLENDIVETVLNAVREDGKAIFTNDTARKTEVSKRLNLQSVEMRKLMSEWKKDIDLLDIEISHQKRLYEIYLSAR